MTVTSSFFAGEQQGTAENENGSQNVANDGGSDSASVSSDKDVTMPTLESLEPDTNG